jgi:hypothetical protein
MAAGGVLPDGMHRIHVTFHYLEGSLIYSSEGWTERRVTQDARDDGATVPSTARWSELADDMVEGDDGREELVVGHRMIYLEVELPSWCDP